MRVCTFEEEADRHGLLIERLDLVPEVRRHEQRVARREHHLRPAAQPPADERTTPSAAFVAFAAAASAWPAAIGGEVDARRAVERV